MRSVIFLIKLLCTGMHDTMIVNTWLSYVHNLWFRSK